jgi:hypothetical protein
VNFIDVASSSRTHFQIGVSEDRCNRDGIASELAAARSKSMPKLIQHERCPDLSQYCIVLVVEPRYAIIAATRTMKV